MQKYTKNYMQSMGFDVGDFIPCEECGAPAVDVHHITPRSLGGSDEPENLIALCRSVNHCHDRAAAGKLSKEYLYSVVWLRMDGNVREGQHLKINSKGEGA